MQAINGILLGSTRALRDAPSVGLQVWYYGGNAFLGLVLSITINVSNLITRRLFVTMKLLGLCGLGDVLSNEENFATLAAFAGFS